MDEDHPIRRSKHAVIALTLALLLFSGTGTTEVYLHSEGIQNTCEAVNGNRAILRGILIRSETLSFRHFQPDQGFTREQIRGYYAHSLRDLAPAPC